MKIHIRYTICVAYYIICYEINKKYIVCYMIAQLHEDDLIRTTLLSDNLHYGMEVLLSVGEENHPSAAYKCKKREESKTFVTTFFIFPVKTDYSTGSADCL